MEPLKGFGFSHLKLFSCKTKCSLVHKTYCRTPIEFGSYYKTFDDSCCNATITIIIYD